MTDKERLFEQILKEFVHPSADVNEESFEMSEVVDEKRHLIDDFVFEK